MNIEQKPQKTGEKSNSRHKNSNKKINKYENLTTNKEKNKMGEERIFNGRIFELYQRTGTRRNANVIARMLRRKGYFIRIVNSEGWYEIWVSERSFFDRFF